MFQTFNSTASLRQGPPRLAALRRCMTQHGIDGFLVPRADSHQGEYVSPRDERLAWLTGFTGSAGFCAVLGDVAGIFIDGRYRTQVKREVADEFTPVPWPETKPADWLLRKLPGGGVVGFDPWLHTAKQIMDLRSALKGHDITMQPMMHNLIDEIWDDQPAPALAPARAHPLDLAGESHADKRIRLGAQIAAKGAQAAAITLPDSLCWLLNIRGADIPRNPIMQGFALLDHSGAVTLFTDRRKLTGLEAHLGADVHCAAPEDFPAALAAISGKVLMDRASVPYLLAQQAQDPLWDKDPCALPKARKNPAEIRGAIAAHLRDGAAMAELLTWLDEQTPGQVYEIDVVRRLEALRARDKKLRDISFDTIAGSGPHGAIIHYRVTDESNRALQAGDLLVLDSGGQYLDGTTDITRTIAIGTPGSEEQAIFTRVLAGMIAVSRLRWPRGLAGRDIQAIGRVPLWHAHQDFDHGIGHGVGAYLSVHEGPQRLSSLSHEPLEAGMILSNEPGYYREGAFGIRIENLLVCKEADAPASGDTQREMLCWRTLSYAPIDRRLIIADMLDADARDWLNRYHAQTFEKIAPLVSEQARNWLAKACAPL